MLVFVPVALAAPTVSTSTATELRASRIAEAIIQLETAGTGDCTRRGGSGETGCFQFMPSTWESYSLEVFGYVAEQTPENEEEVAKAKFIELIEDGYSDRQIFLVWNQGNPGPCRKGVNKYGVKYNSCAYAERGVELVSS